MCRKHASENVTASSSSESAISSAEDSSSAFCESSYTDYLLQARTVLEQCARACRNWSAPYDGEHPPPDSVLEHPASGPVPQGSARDPANSVSMKGSGGDGRENNENVTSDSPDERKRSHSTVKLLSHGNVSASGSVHIPDSEALVQQANSPRGDQRPCGANNAGGGSDAASDPAPSSQRPSNSSSVISETPCNKVPSSSSSSSSTPSPLVSSSHSHPPSQRTALDLSKLCMCLDLDSFLACLNEMDLSAEVSSQSLEESVTSLDHLLSALSTQRDAVPASSATKSVDGTQTTSSDSARSKTEKQSDSQTSPAPPADRPVSDGASSATTVNPALNPQGRKCPAPPKTLGLAPAKEISFGGKCRARSPLRTPDDMSRAFFMSPTSPGFLLSPSSSSSSAAQRPLPAALRYSSSPPDIGKRRFFGFSSSHQRLCCFFLLPLFPAVEASLWLFALCSFLLFVRTVLLCLRMLFTGGWKGLVTQI